MTECRSCGSEVEAQDGTCPLCGAAMGGGTESFPTVRGGDSDVSVESSVQTGPVLLVQKGPEVGQRFMLARDSYTMGRDPARDIFLNDVTVSRAHAEIDVAGDEVTIRDSGSLNGTYVNGARVEEAALRHGDVVQVGRFQMVFLAGGS